MGRASVFAGLVLVLACIGLAKSPQSYRNPSLPTEDGRDLFAKYYNDLVNPAGDIDGSFDGFTDDSDFAVFAAAYDALVCF